MYCLLSLWFRYMGTGERRKNRRKESFTGKKSRFGMFTNCSRIKITEDRTEQSRKKKEKT